MSSGGALCLFFGCAVVLINLNYSALALAIHRLREGSFPVRLPLGIPLLGTTLVGVAWYLAPDSEWRPLMQSLLLADSGGPLWWLAAALRRRWLRHRHALAARAAFGAVRPDNALPPLRRQLGGG